MPVVFKSTEEMKRTVIYPMQALIALSHLHLARKSGRSRPKRNQKLKGDTDQIKIKYTLPTVCFKNSVTRRARPLFEVSQLWNSMVTVTNLEAQSPMAP